MATASDDRMAKRRSAAIEMLLRPDANPPVLYKVQPPSKLRYAYYVLRAALINMWRRAKRQIKQR